MMEVRVFEAECGHLAVSSGAGTGYAVSPDGRKVCYRCATRWTRWSATREQDMWLYLSQDREQVTTWSGGLVMRVVTVHEINHPWKHGRNGGGYMAFTAFLPDDESLWYGRGSPGMAVHVKRSKGTPVR